MIERTRFHRRLGVQLGITVAVVTSVAFGFTVWFGAEQTRATLTREMTLRMLDKSRALSIATAAPLLRRDPELGLHALISRAMSETPDLVDLIVLGTQRTILGAQDLLQVGKAFQAPAISKPITGLPLGRQERVWLDASGHIVIETPVMQLEQHIGFLNVIASRASIEASVRSAQQRLFALGAAGTALAVLASILFVHLNLRPLSVLRTGVQRIGAGDLSTRISLRAENEFGLLADALNSMAGSLKKAQGEIIEKERLDRELQIARELQAMLLPARLTSARGYRLHAHYTPALEVSGDYYDVFELGPHSHAFVVADVSGKGVPGLVVMAMLRSMLRSMAREQQAPADVLAAANDLLLGHMGRGMFITCVYGILDSSAHRFHYASAGHCPMAQFRGRDAAYLPGGGKPIGIFPTPLFRASLVEHTLQLAPGDGLLLYTDGLTEAMDEFNTQLGKDAVLEQLRDAGGTPEHDIPEQLARLARRHRGTQPESDDLTLLTLQRQTAALVITSKPVGSLA